MKKCALVLFVCGSLSAAESTFQDVTLGVMPVNEIHVGRAASILIIDRSDPNIDPNLVVDDELVYSVTTNERDKKIMGFLDQVVPEGTDLKVRLTAPQNAYSTEFQSLSVAPVDLVRFINRQDAGDLRIEYQFSAGDEVGEVPPTMRQVTFLLTDE